MSNQTRPDGGHWLLRPHLVHVRGRTHRVTSIGVYLARDGRLFEIPVGFETDGASVPRLLWWLYPPFGADYECAAVLHDNVYQHAEQFEGRDDGHLSRGEADALMREVMQVDDFRPSGRRVVYRGVRMGGWRTWRRYRNAAAEAAKEEA